MLLLAFDSLDGNFEITIVSLFCYDNKELKKIQQIVFSIESVNPTQQAVRALTDLALIAEKK